MKKFGIIAIAVILLLAAGTYGYFRGKEYHITITQTQIDQALAGRFPQSKDFLPFFTITYSNPQVTLLEESDRVQVGMDVTLDVRIKGQTEKLGGGCTVTSGISYNAQEHTFYLNDAEFDRLEIQGIPPEHLQKVTKFAAKYAKGYIESRPVYRLKATDAKSTAAKLLLKDVDVREQAVHITLGL